MTWPVIKAILRLGGKLLYEHTYPQYLPAPGGEGSAEPWIEEVEQDPDVPGRFLMTDPLGTTGGGGIIAEMDQWLDNERFRLP